MKLHKTKKIYPLTALVTLLALSACVWAARKPEPISGWQAFEEKNYEEAWRQAQTVLSQKSQDLEASWLAAEVTLAQGDTATSLTYWNTVLGESVTHPRAVQKTVEILIDRNELARAQAVLDGALNSVKKPKEKERPEYLYSEGILLNASGNDSGAMLRLSKAIEKNKKEPLFYVALAHVYEKKKVLVLAKDNYLKALALDSTDATVHFELAEVCQDLKQYSEALYHLKITRTLDPNYPDVYYRIGKLYFYAEKYDEAVAELETAIKSGKKPNFFFYSIYGQSLRAVKRLDEAQENLEQAYQLKSTEISTARALVNNSYELKKYNRTIDVLKALLSTPDAENSDYGRLGESYYYWASKDTAQASALYDSSLVYMKKGYALNPNSTRLPTLIATTHFNLDQYDSAAVYYDLIASADSTNYQAFFKLGYCCIKLDRNKEAIAKLRHALTLDSTKISARMMLAQTLSFEGLNREAKQEFRKIIQQDPNQGDAYGSLGFIYLKEAMALPEDTKRDEVEKAWEPVVEQFRRATDLVPKNVGYWVGYGHSSFMSSSFKTAVYAFDQALSLERNNKDAKTGKIEAEKWLKRTEKK